MTKISIVGAPSTGKTILARHLTNTLSMTGFDADNVLEYARTYLFRYIKPVKRKKQNLLDQVMIYTGQKRREEDLKYCEFVICDSATFIPYIFAGISGYDLNDPRDVMVVHKLFKWSIQEITTYDFIFYLPPDIEYKPKDAEWKVSSGDERADIARRIESYLLDIKFPYFRVESKDTEERGEFIMDILAEKVDGIKEKINNGYR